MGLLSIFPLVPLIFRLNTIIFIEWRSLKRSVTGTDLDRMDVMVLLDLIGAKNPTFISTQVRHVTFMTSFNSHLGLISHYIAR